jgi:outer membrane receptor protein involved in Fe transport
MTPMTRRVLTKSIWLALTATFAAQAQDAPKAPDAEGAAVLEKITVTAEKRTEDVKEVPMSISVIDTEQLQNFHSTQLTDYAGYLPGFTVIDGGAPGQQTLGVRGITPLSAGSTVATYID